MSTSLMDDGDDADPQSLLQSHAWALFNAGEFAAAARDFAQLRAHHPDNPQGYIGGGVACRRAGAFVEADAIYVAGLARLPQVQALYLDYAWCADERGDWAEALRRWEPVITRNPELPLPRRQAASALLALNRSVEAASVLAPAARMYPEDRDILAISGWIALSNREFKQADTIWSTLRRLSPDLPDGFRGGARALRKLGRFEEAHALLTEALRRFPDDADVAADAAEAAGQVRSGVAGLDSAAGRLAVARDLRQAGRLTTAATQLRAALERFPAHLELEVELGFTLAALHEWPAALALWESLKARHPRHEGVASNITVIVGQALIDQGITGQEAFTIPRALLESANVDNQPKEDVPALLKRFESLGDSCEFGMVQRMHQVEQMSLLRWARTAPHALITALDSRLAGVGDPEHTLITVEGDEYRTADRRYGMASHTFTSPLAEPLESFAPEQCKRIQWLRRKLLDSLTAATKIFVYTCQTGLSDADALELYAALERYSPQAKLLCVRVADPAHPVGSVERLRGDLYMGYIDKFSTVDVSVAVWLTLCRTTLERLA